MALTILLTLTAFLHFLTSAVALQSQNLDGHYDQNGLHNTHPEAGHPTKTRLELAIDQALYPKHGVFLGLLNVLGVVGRNLGLDRFPDRGQINCLHLVLPLLDEANPLIQAVEA